MLLVIVKAFFILAFGRRSIGALMAILIGSIVQDDMHREKRAWKIVIGGNVRSIHKHHHYYQASSEVG
jgi:hypothetical protein